MSDVLLFDLSQHLEKLFSQQRYDAGFALGRHILRYYPRHLATYKQMGMAALAKSMWEDSIDLLQRALSIDPEDIQMWEALRSAAMATELQAEAALAADYIKDLHATSEETTPVAAGHDAARQQDWVRAYEAYRAGYAQHPQRMDAALGLVTALFHLEAYDAALLMTNHILEELPYCLKAHWQSIRCAHLLQDQTVDVQRHLRIARGIDPDGRYLLRWFDDVQEEKLAHPRALIPAWDESERWAYHAATP
ncbi:MAG: hypothetical protein DSY55_06605 [Clostridia bacterium]|nr:MAG: hypothetical protein DSY55_06605 [Clostridia bacterium]